ncbi:MAG TPA: hypothetical protein VGY97_07295, partial [Solirubrobacteraceae bacterium]|nr:hypothetical protein [Solirubrobacteraceae bacterium]
CVLTAATASAGAGRGWHHARASGWTMPLQAEAATAALDPNPSPDKGTVRPADAHPHPATGGDPSKTGAPKTGPDAAPPQSTDHPSTPDAPGAAGEPGAHHSGEALPGPAAEGVKLLSAAGAPAPVLGRSVAAAPATGTVLVQAPGSERFTRLSDATSTPVDSVVDARQGTVVLSTALAGGRSAQMASFSGGEFRVSQSPTAGGLTDIELVGGSFASCPRSRLQAHGSALAASARQSPTAPHSVIRRLWASDNHGHFRTHGRSSVATVRGTSWLTVDRCDGTLTRVSNGQVSVRDLRRHRTVVVSAGHSHLAPGH